MPLMYRTKDRGLVMGISKRVSAGTGISGVVVLMVTGCGGGSGVSLAEELETLPWLGGGRDRWVLHDQCR